MKNKYHSIIRDRLKQFKQEAKDCIWGGSYPWSNEKRTLALVNNILKDIPSHAWPQKQEFPEDNNTKFTIRNGSWKIHLFWGYEDNKRHANLIYDHDDHTAWVREHRTKKNKFVNHDIGGS